MLQRQTWPLDGPGNWPSTTTTTGGVPTTETRTHNNLNQITAINAAPLTYDSNGNLTDDGTYTLAWDAKNRLRKATRKSDSVVIGIYAYDAFGRRIRRIFVAAGTPTPPAVTVHYYLDGQRVIEERELTPNPEPLPPSENLARQYTYGPYIDECLTLDRDLNGNGVATDPGERLFYHANTLYSIYALSDANRNQPERYLYDAYGRPILWLPGPDATYGTADDIRTVSGISAVGNVRLFTGREWNAETVLFYFRARVQSPALGRFLSRDPILHSNQYAYVYNYPGLFTDPQGADPPFAPWETPWGSQLPPFALPASAIPAGPRLSWKTVSGPTAGPCGEFTWVVQWSIKPPTKKGGQIIQHVQVLFDITDCCGNPIDVKAHTGGNVDPSWWPLWEAWSVNASNTIGPAPTDTFAMPSFGVDTKGTIRMYGTAEFYEGLTLPASFVNQNRPPAGILPVTQTDPKISGGTGSVQHNLVASWACCPSPEKTIIATGGFAF